MAVISRGGRFVAWATLALVAACGGRTAHPPRLPSDITPTRALSEDDAIRIALANDVGNLYDVRLAWAEMVAATQRVKLRAYLLEQIKTTSNEVERFEEVDRAERATHERQIARDRLCTSLGLGACLFEVRLEEPSLAMPPDDDAPGEVRVAREELRMAIGSYDLWHRTISPRVKGPLETVNARLREVELALEVRKARAKLER